MEEPSPGVRIIGDEIVIDDPDIISGLEDLAQRWDCDPGEALRRCLERRWQELKGMGESTVD